jgi:predicted nucleic acid-binding protein
MNLVDTDVLIDCLRGAVAAAAWLSQVEREPFAVPGVVAMELVMGCSSRRDLDRIQRFLGEFDIVWPQASEFAAAYRLLVAHRLTSGVSIPDCTIAAMALARAASVYTFNLKHFQVIPGLDVREPYSRPR